METVIVTVLSQLLHMLTIGYRIFRCKSRHCQSKLILGSSVTRKRRSNQRGSMDQETRISQGKASSCSERLM